MSRSAADLPDSDLLTWPAVPTEQRPKKLYHRGLVDAKADAVLIAKGWMPIDVRLLPNVTDDDRRLSLKAWLEGIRHGTIELDPRLSKWLELEAKVYEIHKGVADKPSHNVDDSGKSVDYMLNFGSASPWTSTLEIKAKSTKKKRGRHAEDDGSEK